MTGKEWKSATHLVAVLLLDPIAPALAFDVDHPRCGIVGEFVGMVVGVYHTGVVHLSQRQLFEGAICRIGNHDVLCFQLVGSSNLTQNQSHLVAQAVVNV